MSIFTKKTKIVLYNENQKDEMIEKLESQLIEYKLKEKRGELMSDDVYYELIIAEADLRKVS
ncbi:MAG: hypothetical protein K5929_09440 [Lachnospiraceae bacterium]|nr:hypothetical protein [Lachnospiraceae bacterium]